MRQMSEPRDIEKDKEMLLAIGSPITWSFQADNMVFAVQALEDLYPALVHYITQYEAAQARIAELEGALQLIEMNNGSIDSFHEIEKIITQYGKGGNTP